MMTILLSILNIVVVQSYLRYTVSIINQYLIVIIFHNTTRDSKCVKKLWIAWYPHIEIIK